MDMLQPVVPFLVIALASFIPPESLDRSHECCAKLSWVPAYEDPPRRTGGARYCNPRIIAGAEYRRCRVSSGRSVSPDAKKGIIRRAHPAWKREAGLHRGWSS